MTVSAAPSRKAWLVTGSAVALTVLLLVFTARQVVSSGEGGLRLLEFPTALAFVVVGAALASRRRNLIGWLFVSLGLLVAIVVAAQQYAVHAPGEPALPGADWAAWLGVWPVEFFPAMLALLFLVFPDGLLSPRWRPLAGVIVANASLGALASALSDVNFANTVADASHPLQLIRPSVVSPFYSATQVIGLALLFPALASAVVRYRRSNGDERQQLKWVAYASAVTIASVSVCALLGLEPLVAFHLFLPAIAVATAVAIAKYRLYDIDVLVNRTIVYVVLTAVIATVYGGSVGLVGAIVEGNAGRGSFVLVGGLVAIFFGPLRQRVQRAVDRLMYGHRDDPYDVISRVGHRLAAPLAPEAVLPDFAEVVAQILRLPSVSIEVRREDGFEVIASQGTPRGQPVAVPFVYQGETIGRLVVSKRAPSEELSAADRRLLEDLARQAGTVVHVLRLGVELQRSRERLVSAREEERRRLRRDLHDGLGPALAGVALQMENAAALIDQDPDTARATVCKLNGQIQAAVADIRRLVYDLRPPALDELGLVAAIRQQALQFTTRPGVDGGNALVISVEAPERLDGLPAAVEVAAYRIVTEAMANTFRHAEARHCTVSIDIDHDLEIGVSDDGKGIRPDAHWGVGLTSMKERAAELGGSSAFEPGPTGGTRVRVRLPIGEQ